MAVAEALEPIASDRICPGQVVNACAAELPRLIHTAELEVVQAVAGPVPTEQAQPPTGPVMPFVNNSMEAHQQDMRRAQPGLFEVYGTPLPLLASLSAVPNGKAG